MTFRAEYRGDFERPILFDGSCRARTAIGVGAVSPALNPNRIPALAAGDKFHARFTGKILRVTASNAKFHNDDGYRINILAASGGDRRSPSAVR